MAGEDPYQGLWLLLPGFAGFAYWCVAYALIIRRGFLDRTVGMPLVALCANFAWELLFGFVYPDKEPFGTVNKVWCAVDLVIVLQFLRFGAAKFPAASSKRLFVPTFVVVQLMAFSAIFTAYHQFDDFDGAITAYADNIMMSGLFVWWALSRDDVDGQSIWIGIAKGLGTLSVSLAQLQMTPNAPFLTYAYLACFALDLAYIVLLYRRIRAMGINPWSRF